MVRTLARGPRINPWVKQNFQSFFLSKNIFVYTNAIILHLLIAVDVYENDFKPLQCTGEAVLAAGGRGYSSAAPMALGCSNIESCFLKCLLI